MGSVTAASSLLTFLLLVACSASAPQWPGSCTSADEADRVIKGISLHGRVAVITGADGNIAQEVCLSLARAGASLVLGCRQEGKCEAVRRRIAAEVGNAAQLEVDSLDLSSSAHIGSFANRTMLRHPRIDMLINSAGTYGTFKTKDGLVGAMEVNLLGPALLTHLLLPALRGRSPPGRVVNVAGAAYGVVLPTATTVHDLTALCTDVDPVLDRTGGYFQMSKFLMTHHAVELARREPTVAAFAVNPGVAVLKYDLPEWLKRWVMHTNWPHWLLNLLPEMFGHFAEACKTNEVGLASCPQSYAQGAGVVAAAAAWPGVEPFSGSFLDYETAALPPTAPQVYGPFVQKDPTCVPRPPPPMDEDLRSAWYDEMLRLMSSLADSTQVEVGALRRRGVEDTVVV